MSSPLTADARAGGGKVRALLAERLAFLDRWAFRRKLKLFPSLAAVALALVLVVTLGLGVVNERRLTQIERGYYPSVQLSRTLSERLSGIQRSLQDAVGARDSDKLAEADALRDAFRRDLDRGLRRGIVGADRLTEIRGQFESYYKLARSTSERLIAGEGGDDVVRMLDAMRSGYRSIKLSLDASSASDQEAIERAFRSARYAERAGWGVITLITIAFVCVLWALSDAAASSVTRPLGVAVDAAERLSRGDVSARLTATSASA